TLVSTLSVAAGVANVAIAPVGPVASSVCDGTGAMCGGVRSLTVTVKLALPVLPCASVAEHVTVATPRPNKWPWSQAGVSDPSTPSVAVAVKSTNVAALVAATLIGPGTVTTGAV